ncbi:YigZ family protein [Candidatus Izimaplasma sp. ZiA1]|uniref:YigZ family protein n=1 Tax=Candidatus Izimoplasma sp. ZiA1 TaxID=2024899 RepID=UPI00143A56F3
MKSIKNVMSTELIINKSTFITVIYPINAVDDVLKKLNEVKEQYKDATHYCTAYIIGDNQEIQKFDDNGEPSKTAGYRMLEVLKKNDLTNVFAVTVRFYGGIKLGAGGLVRAYTKGVASLINNAEFSYKQTYYKFKLSVDFNSIGKVEKHIRDNYLLFDVEYTDKVNYYIELKKQDLESLKFYFIEVLNGNIEFTLVDEYFKYI